VLCQTLVVIIIIIITIIHNFLYRHKVVTSEAVAVADLLAYYCSLKIIMQLGQPGNWSQAPVESG